MGMTNDIDKIREITGYEPGKAFIYGFNEDGRVRRECVETYGVDTPGEPVVYDTRTKNFHIFPNSMEITDEILQSEADLRLKVYNYFIEYCNNNKETFDVIKYEKSRPSENARSKKLRISEEMHDKMVIDKVVDCKKGEGCGKNKVTRGLYKYLPFYYNGKIYNINFMRFYIDKEAKVNVIYNAYQFDASMTEYTNQNYIGYPTSDKEHNLDELRNFTHNIYYNPQINCLDFKDTGDIENHAREVAKEFVAFIDKCEELTKKE